jgi:DNA-binding response OmpR family regulator
MRGAKRRILRGPRGALNYVRATSAVRCTNPIVLIVDNEPRIADRIRPYLLPRYRTCQAAAPMSQEEVPLHFEPALIVLNPDLVPGSSREDLLFRGRARVPLIIVSTAPTTIDAVEALDAGADDYLPKPYNPRELAARIEAVLRGYAAQHIACRYLHVGDLELNIRTRQMHVSRQTVDLGRREFDLLRLLVERPGLLIPYAEVAERIWGSTGISRRTINLTIVQLRQYLIGSAAHIHVLAGVGLKLEPECRCGIATGRRNARSHTSTSDS